MGPPAPGLPRQPRAPRSAPEDVDLAVNTHLHADHIGGNTRLADGAWVPTFPNATHLMTKTDLEFWDPANNPDIVGSVNENSFEDSLELWLPARSRRTSGCPGSGPSGRRR